MFTQLNQYHVVLEAMPALQQKPRDLDHIYIKTATERTRCRLSAIHDAGLNEHSYAAGGQSPGAVSGGDGVV